MTPDNTLGALKLYCRNLGPIAAARQRLSSLGRSNKDDKDAEELSQEGLGRQGAVGARAAGMRRAWSKRGRRQHQPNPWSPFTGGSLSPFEMV